MGRRGACLAPCLGVLFAAALALAGTPSAYAGGAPKIGAMVEDFTLVDVHKSEAASLSDFGEADVLVLMFIATQCPVSNDYNSRMAELLKAYEERPVQFIGINSNKQESFSEVLEHARENELTCPILKDVDNKIADRLDALVTPEVYLLQVMCDGEDAEFVLRYHGAIDDSQSVEKVEHRYLRDSLDAVLAGEEVPKTETKAFGCTIKRVEKDRAPFAAP